LTDDKKKPEPETIGNPDNYIEHLPEADREGVRELQKISKMDREIAVK
jgi:hypothetical protein